MLLQAMQWKLMYFFCFQSFRPALPDFRYREPESGNALIFSEKRQPEKPLKSIRVQMAPQRVKKNP
jgi:hypothetical protein